jgi:hypothetical protein
MTEGDRPVVVHSRRRPAIVEIDPAKHWPAGARLKVREAMLRYYEGQLWRNRGELVRLDPETGTLEKLSNRAFRALAPEAVVYVQRRRLSAEEMAAELHKESTKAVSPFVMAHIDVPTRVLDDVYNGPHWPELVAVRRAPWVTAGGRLVAKGGHDEETGIYLHWNDEPCDPQSVTQAEIEDVLARLTDFQFASPADRLNYIALLVQLVRMMQGHPAPLGLVNALEAESAKTLVTQIVGLLALGHRPSASKLPTNATEQHYTIDAYVREQPPILWLDNVATGATLGGSDLHAILTAAGDVVSRIVGTGAVGRGDPTRIQWLATGNQINVDAELARRVNMVQLRVRAASRRFLTPNIVEWVLDNRRLILSVLLRLVLDWHAVGCPKPPRLLPSFEEWSRLVGGPLCLDPQAAALWLSAASRPVPQVDLDFKALCEAWPPDKRGHVQPLAPRMIFALLTSLDVPGLQERLGEGNDSARQRKLATFLRERAQQQRPTCGWRLVRQLQGNNALYLPLPYVGPPEGQEGGSNSGPSGPGDPGGGRSRSQTGAESEGRSREYSDSGGINTEGTGEPESPESPEWFPSSMHGGLGPSPSLPPPPSSLVGYPPPNHSGDSGDSGWGGTPYTISPESDRSHRSGEGVPLGEGGRSTGGGFEVRIGRDDVAYDAVCAMAERGIRVDAALWVERSAAAAAAFESSGTAEDRDRLKNLRSYSATVYGQALTGDRVRCSWELQGPGRIGTVKPSLHQITKRHGMRTPILPAEGCRFVVGDWRAAHVWIAAGMSRDARMLEELSAGALYERAAGMWKTTAERAKVCLLATLNGAGPARLAEILADGTTESEAKKRRDKWLGTYPEMRGVLRRWYGGRAWRSPLGRLVAMPDDRDDYSAVGWRLQAIEADALRLALQRLSWDVVLTVHDELLLEVAESEAERAAADLRVAMDESLRELADLRDMQGDTVRVEVRRAWRES